MERIVLGFSGGVDSAVSAVLLKKAGYEVVGLYLDNADTAALACAEDAAAFIGIRFESIDIKAELEEKVCTPFQQAYLSGETPNPCILCNPAIKFKHLLSYADKIGADSIATGHYARAENGMLFKGHPENDQSYMLCRITREQLRKLVLPLGQFAKREVRALAEEFSLPVAHKPDSMEICFIPDKDYIGWLSRRTALPVPGKLLLHGQEIGMHKGIHCYTVGQRFPGLMDGRKIYISKINAADNTIELAFWDELFHTEVLARDFNWLCETPSDEITATVRVRHTKWENPPCKAHICEDNTVLICCEEPVRAPAAGQSAVLYAGDRVLGGGFILT